ncbi:hypothetical protein BACIT_2838 [Bacillus amyloliquefaciens]|nr:hypothetical protein BACIT_2838 [Bacillus amyloliquefaciens]
MHSPDCQETEAKCSGICFILSPPARSYEKRAHVPGSLLFSENAQTAFLTF